MFWGLEAFEFFKVFGKGLLFLSLSVASVTSQLEFSCVRTMSASSRVEPYQRIGARGGVPSPLNRCCKDVDFDGSEVGDRIVETDA